MSNSSNPRATYYSAIKALAFLVSLFLFDWLVLLKLLKHILPSVSEQYLSFHHTASHVWVVIILSTCAIPLLILFLIVDLNSELSAFVCDCRAHEAPNWRS